MGVGADVDVGAGASAGAEVCGGQKPGANVNVNGSKSGGGDASLPLKRLLFPAVVFAGVQLAWAVQIGHFTAHLRRLGLPAKYVGLAWLGGPISGIIAQPLVGVASDNCKSRMGKRRPFMLVGALAVALFLVIFGYAADIAGALKDPVNARGGGSRTGVWVALGSFWALDFAINVIQMPSRALLADMVPSHQLVMGSSLFALANGLGKAIGYTVGGFHADVRLVTIFAAVFVIFFAFAPTVFYSEQSQPENNDSNTMERPPLFVQVLNFARELWSSLLAMPASMRQAFGIQVLTYLSFQITFIYVTEFVGAEVFRGNPNAAPSSASHATYSRGVLFANRCLLAMSLVSILFAGGLSTLTRRCGFRVVWGSSLAVMGISLMCTLVPRLSQIATFFIILGSAPALAAAFTLPWALVSASLRGNFEDQRGLFLSVFNLSQATPGLLASFAGTILIHLTNRVATALALGGAAALLGAVACAQVTLPEGLICANPIKVSNFYATADNTKS